MKPGHAFGDYITTGKRSKYNNDHFDSKSGEMRGYLIPLILLLSFGLLLIQLFYLQIIKGGYYSLLSDSNRIKTTVIHAPRGIIFDRHGKPMVFNTPGFRQTTGDKTKLITRDAALHLLAKGEKNLAIDALRNYPYKDAAAHVLGYIGQISKEDLQESTYKDYRAGDLIGKMGLEKQYEELLRGIDGKKLDEVDSSGKAIRILGQTDPLPGQNVHTTLDVQLQQVAYDALKDAKKGVIIATTVNGEILALVSKPSFDTNLLTLDETYKPATTSAYQSVTQILTDTDNQPLLNRAIGGVYPPGSTFKLVTAAAGLESKKIDQNFEVEDIGILRVGAFSFGNWYFLQYGGKDGTVDVVKGIKRSNDIYFYKAAEKMGPEVLSKMARDLGMGNSLGIDLPGEVSGIVPTNEWKKEVIGEQWYLGDTYHYGIGQGYVLTTPLQVNAFTQAIVNKGTLYKPHFLKTGTAKTTHTVSISDKTLSLIRQGMIESCSPTGVAWPLFEFKVKNPKLKVDGKNILEAPQSTMSANFKDYRKISVACKTGTAQHGGEKTLPHAWITLFAPAYDPQIIVTVLVESGGEGSSVAGPVAKKVLEEWFSR